MMTTDDDFWSRYTGVTRRTIVKRSAEIIEREKERAHLRLMMTGRDLAAKDAALGQGAVNATKRAVPPMLVGSGGEWRDCPPGWKFVKVVESTMANELAKVLPTEIKMCGYRDFLQPASGQRIPWTRDALVEAVGASGLLSIDYEFGSLGYQFSSPVSMTNAARSCRLIARTDGLYAVDIAWHEQEAEKIRSYTHLVPALMMTAPGPDYRVKRFDSLALTCDPIDGFGRIDWGNR